jgi:ribosomal protein S18 acetylase RimI-like enzyme
MPWLIQRLDASIDIGEFDCGENSLNLFLKRHALNNDRAGLGRTFVALEVGGTRTAGYFTVSTGSVNFTSIPKHVEKRLPRYPIPTVHLGRLAVDRGFQRRGLGEILLIEAMQRAAAASDNVGVYAFDVIALNDQAKQFYLRYGFLEMMDDPMHLFIPMETARQIVQHRME